MRRSERGQILPLFAATIIVICGLAALAIDVSSVYSARRAYRSASDAAALAGAQSLFRQGTRVLTSTEHDNARSAAFKSIKQRLLPQGTWASCTSTTTAECKELKDAGGNAVYRVKVKSPIGSGCVDCDPLRSVGVEITRPAYPLTFARILGFSSFKVTTASVAGLRVRKAYTIVTLRPPDDSRDPIASITFGGSDSVVSVHQGDVASNGNMVYGGGDEQLVLDPDFDFDYYDPFDVGRRWETAKGIVPDGNRLATPILDPGYTIPVKPSGAWGPQPILTADADAPCKRKADDLRLATNYGPYFTGVPDTKVTCWDPGTYDAAVIPGDEIAILSPGIYFFPTGLDVKGGLIGGYTPSSPGVALVFGRSGEFKNITPSSNSLIALNAGSRPLDRTTATTTEKEALPAKYPNNNTFGSALKGTSVQTEDGKPLTVMVQGNGTCRVLAHSTCSPSSVLQLVGRAAIYLAGVQYAPEDDARVSGRSGGIGIIGQIWAWTVTYTGNSQIFQGGADKARPGPVRLDVACSVPATSTVPDFCPSF